MNFTFSEDQEIFRDAFKKYLESNVTPEKIRSGWEDNMPFNQARWQELEELGILQSNLDEKYGGLGLDLVTSCLLVEEMGYYALPEPAAEQIFLSNLLINKSIDIAELIEEKGLIIFKINANRFLRNMVRAIVGTLIEVGRKRISLKNFEKIIIEKNRSNAGFSAPAHGLFLTDIDYDWNKIK